MPAATTSNYLHDKQMNYLLTGASWTPPISLWVALFVTAPGLDGQGATEVSTSGTGYGRVQISSTTGWTGPTGANREFTNAAELSYNFPTANWGAGSPITAAGLYDASTAGNLFYVAYLTTPKTVNNGDGAPKILVGQLRITRATC